MTEINKTDKVKELYILIEDTIDAYDKEHPDDVIKSDILFNTCITIATHLLIAGFNNDIVQIRKTLDATMSAILDAVREYNIKEIKELK